MTTLTTLLDACWWLIPLGLLALCLFRPEDRGFPRGTREGARPGVSALDVLDRRYASGEIGPVEYQEKVLTMGLRNPGP